MLRKPLLELIYESAHMQRWNDHIRPKGFTEMDKQGHKMIIAYMLAKFEEEERQMPVDWRGLIEGGIFEFFHRIVLTDIKPSVAHELMARHGARLNEWIMEQLQPQLECLGEEFSSKFKTYFDDPQYCRQEKKLLKAAHYLATDWEFQIIHNLNANIFGLEETKARIENEIEEYYDLLGVRKAGLGKKTNHFINLVGQLRFQQRWAQSPRVPETSVMGHMLVVAMLAYLLSVEIGACDQRLCNNFFAGLFHDLPEVLTRDIVSPVKRSVAGLEELIKEIENRQIQEKVLPLLPVAWHAQLLYFIEDEFANKIQRDGVVEKVKGEEVDQLYNRDEFSPIDGQLLKGCDHLAAYIEARLSMAHGITSRHLRDGSEKLYRLYQNRSIAGIDFGQMFDYFQ
ncbi:HD domain-containing protein [Azotosporobacter soli]|uniref:HD domain-containing protein n=1 Tax=Azotosporobacter soli TaxID=3055040 RepID=UPI0031FE9E14